MSEPTNIIGALQLAVSSKKQLKIQDIAVFIEKILQTRQNFADVSFIQKGVILELLTRSILQFTLNFQLSLNNYKDNLHRGGTKTRDEATIQKTKGRKDRGNTTTVKKKKKYESQLPRNGELLDIEQLLEKQLSSQMKSINRQKDGRQDSQKIFIDPKIEELNQMYVYYNTKDLRPEPEQNLFTLNKIKEKTQQNLGELEELILAPKQTARKITKKTSKNVTTKKNKPKITQLLSQQINSYIDLAPVSQQIGDQVRKILQQTKKKKKILKQKQNTQFFKQIFNPQQNHYDNFLTKLSDFTLIKNFQEKIRQKKQLVNDYMDQEDLQFGAFVQQSYSKQKKHFTQKGERISFQFNIFMVKIEGEVESGKQVSFNKFSDLLQLDSNEKSNLFYQLLCNEDLSLSQDNVASFGDILIQNRSRVSV